MIDYKTQTFENLVHDIDVVLDAVPYRDNVERIKSVMVLRECGVLASVNVDLPFNDEVKEALAKKKASGELVLGLSRQDWLEEIA